MEGDSFTYYPWDIQEASFAKKHGLLSRAQGPSEGRMKTQFLYLASGPVSLIFAEGMSEICIGQTTPPPLPYK